MDPISIGTAIGGSGVNCVKAGQYLIAKYQSYKNAERETSELILLLQGQWFKIKDQVGFLDSIWETLDADFQIYQITVLQVLNSKLQAAVDKVDSLIDHTTKGGSLKQLIAKKGDINGLKYAARIKDSLKKYNGGS